jgi:hypothetical protein
MATTQETFNRGQQTMSRPFHIIRDNDAARSMVEKIDAAEEGSVVPLTDAELEEYLLMRDIPAEPQDLPILPIKVEPGESYLLFIEDGMVNIPDVLKSSEKLGVDLRIIRYRKEVNVHHED